MSIQTIKDTIKNTILPQGTKIKRAKHLEANDAIIDGLYSELYYSDWGVPKPYLSNTLPTDGVYVWCNVQNQTKTEAECHPKFWNIMKSMTVYGGDGVTTIGVPYIPGGTSLVQIGNISIGNTLTTIELGVIGGEAGVTLTKPNLPSGSYGYIGDFGDGWPDSSNDRTSVGAVNSYARQSKQMILGTDQAHNNMSPYIGVNYILRIK